MKTRLIHCCFWLFGFAFCLAVPTFAATFTVNSNLDGPDNSPGDGQCQTDSDTCTLRAAMQEANALAGADIINFNINSNPGGAQGRTKSSVRSAVFQPKNSPRGSKNGSQYLVWKAGDGAARWQTVQLGGVQTITPLTALPSISGPVTIDGYTQPGASANTLAVGDNAQLRIEIDGSNVSNGGVFTIQSGGAGSTLRGLVVNRAPYGVFMIAGANVVEGCFFGTNPAGTAASRRPAALGASGGGIFIVGGDGNRIGGATPAARNVIVPNSAEGIRIGNGPGFLPGATNTLVQGNYIGTDAQGTVALNAGGFLGVSVFGANSTTIGGLTNVPGTGAGNLISGNGTPGNGIGIYLNGSLDGGVGATVVVQGNLIGTNAAGNAAISNPQFGVLAGSGFTKLLIGGPQAGARNVISGNGASSTDAGLSIATGTNFVSDITVQNNLIGVGVDGTTALPNLGDGIRTATSSAASVLIGGVTAGQGNVILNNTGIGIAVNGDINNFTSQVTIRGNSLFNNGGLGIRVAVPSGGSSFQNYPVFTSASTSGGGLQATGTLSSKPNTSYQLDFFASPSADSSGFGEGKTYLGAQTVVTDGAGNAPFTVSFPGASGAFLSATATGSVGTSSFSASIATSAAAVSPTLSIGDISKIEGNSGTANLVFTVTLSSASASPVTVKYATANGSALSGSDYNAASGTLSIAAGALSGQIKVPIRGDVVDENDETFSVNLTAPVGATLADAQGVGLILDDDTATLNVADLRVVEGNSGSKTVDVVATLSTPADSDQFYVFSTSDGTGNGGAKAGSDYTATSGNFTIAAGALSANIPVSIKGDTTSEPDETFLVTVLPAAVDRQKPRSSQAVIGKGTATVTIVNDDQVGPLPTLSINDVTLPEGNSGTTNAVFTVTLSAASGAPVTVKFATSNGTATAPDDYTASSGTLTIPAGAKTATVAVPIVGDTLVEANETFTVSLSGASGATIADGTGVGTIINDDVASSVTDVSAQFTVSKGKLKPLSPYLPGLFDKNVKRYSQKITLKNNGAALSGPITLILNGLPTTISVPNASGQTEALVAPGRFYFTLPIGIDNVLQKGESVSVTAEFRLSHTSKIEFTPQVLAGSGAR